MLGILSDRKTSPCLIQHIFQIMFCLERFPAGFHPRSIVFFIVFGIARSDYMFFLFFHYYADDLQIFSSVISSK